MPDPLYPNTGTDFLAETIRAALSSLTVHLFKNNVSLNADTILSNLQEADFSGYAEVTNTALLPVYRDPAGGSSFRIPTDQFNYYKPSSVASVAIGAGGSGYTSAPTVTFSGGGGQGATGHSVLTADAVSSIVVDTPGYGYTSAPTVTLTGGAGTGATATATTSDTGKGISGVNVTAGGTGYTTPPVVAFSGGGGSGAIGEAVITGGVVTSVNVLQAGTGYTSAPSVGFTGGGGSGAAATTTIDHITNSIFGWWVEDSAGTFILGANYDGGIVMANPGDAIPQDITFRFGN